MKVASAVTTQGRYECPACGHEDENPDGWEMPVGCERECGGCGATLVISEEDFDRWLTWTVATPPVETKP
jgi:hypothetical protein